MAQDNTLQSPPEAGFKERSNISFGEFEHSAGFILRIAQLASFEALFALLVDDGFKIGEFTILLSIAENPNVRQGMLADVLQIKWSNMTKLVRSLEARELVERIIPPNDRRSVRLGLTDKGREIMEMCRPRMIEADRQALGMLDDSEYRQLSSLLRKVAGWSEVPPKDEQGAQ